MGLLQATLGTGTGTLQEVRGYNHRTWLNCLWVGSQGSVCPGTQGTVYLISSINYAGDGDVISASDSVDQNWTYAYDGFNRLS